MKLMLGKADDSAIPLAEEAGGVWKPSQTLAADMAKFMIAHLALGAAPSGRILAESTAVLMHSRLFGGDPPAEFVPLFAAKGWRLEGFL